ncbi:bifunctional phosphopantothenoylcysteine decarboxylase/phosphopantothenate--cysteine ligase CoaBC [Sodalinema gerasimenkoae]|uniref:bifunctional phosphopantothenoylcysteine decarboxylase/phosphopantothenate--cysteine ligase CoaBC n=1 Tax=Sodalinema gerasimenkoae TaxID=2862348 RepID=UPI001358290F|nr:bifunctional phosphopantothenoylcysteine decarboxylase/phosphopantothenate--cysteine ligase CoaBC [Sodalinema gerasimenkoae]
MASLTGRRVLIGLTGGIAAYKVCEVVSRLVQDGAEVRVILTSGAQAFVTPLTLATLSRHPAYTDESFWQSIHGRPLHIELGEWADVFAIAPLTANTLAKLSHGLADNLLTNVVLASTCPVLLAPAMNTDMWEQQTVQENWQRLQQNPRFHGISPGAGLLACDRIGMGRMAPSPRLVTHIESLLHTAGKQDLAGRHVLVSAGGTREYFDPVRFIGNPATGKMGIAVAQAAAHRGATVTLVHSCLNPEAISDLTEINSIPVTNAEEMSQQMQAHFPEADWVVMTAAVADVKPAQYYGQKLAKDKLPSALPLVPVKDIVAALAEQKQAHQRLIGFAAQTGDIVTPALEKLRRKKLDAIVANPIDLPNAGFGSNTNQAVFIDANGNQSSMNSCTKLQLAHYLLDWVEHLDPLLDD